MSNANQAPGSDPRDSELEGDLYDLSFSINKSRRYHEKLTGFYAAWRDAMKIVTAMAGSGAFVLVTAEVEHWAAAAAAFIALWAVVDIIVSPDKRAEVHKELGQRFVDLAARIAKSPRTTEAYSILLAERLTIERDEPPVKRLVDLLARNDECRARDFPSEDQVPLSWSQRRFGYFATFGLERLERWQANRRRQVNALASQS